MALTEKQAAFCRAYIETRGNATEAYRRSYDAENMKDGVIRVKAHELLKNGNVAVTIEQMQEEARERHNITIDTLTRMLIEDRELARTMESPSPSAAVAAAMGIAKLHGLIVDKTKNDHTSDGKPMVPVVNVFTGTKPSSS